MGNAPSLRGRAGWRGAGPSRPEDDERLSMQRYGQAWAQALHMARRLVLEFGAARVVAIGALVRPERFQGGSGLELVVWGLRADVFDATRDARDALPVTILDGDHLTPAQAARVRDEGIELARLGRA